MPAVIAFLLFFVINPSVYAVTVVGVIAGAEHGVALIRPKEGANTRVVKPGENLEPGVTVKRITAEFVELQIKDQIQRMKIGEEYTAELSTKSQAHLHTATYSSTGHTYAGGGIERQGNQVRITPELRDHIVHRELSKVLMQAAAIPYYIAGELRGFKLWDIDAGSLYELVGFKNGDIVTAVNGSEIVDVGSTIRLLHSLRDADAASVNVLRSGSEQTITISIY